jgi:hypothetical protein
MALDTRDKRASSIGLGLAALLVLPAPGTLDQPDRQHVAFSYRGVAASTPITGAAAVIALSGSYDRTIRITGSYDRVIQITGDYD